MTDARREAEALVQKFGQRDSVRYTHPDGLALIDAIEAYGARCAARAVEAQNEKIRDIVMAADMGQIWRADALRQIDNLVTKPADPPTGGTG